VRRFNGEVANWTAARAALNASSFTFVLNGSEPVALPPVTARDRKGDSHSELGQRDVVQFESLRFERDELSSGVREPDVPPRHELSRKPLPAVPAAVELALRAVGPGGASSEIAFGLVRLYEWATTGANQKMCRVQVSPARRTPHAARRVR
jgi:hypothetical protein